MPSAAATHVTGVPRSERIVRRFTAHREAGEPAALTKRPEALAPTGEDLVHVGLVADVPHELVVREIQHAMQRERQLDDAQVGREMPAVGRARANEQVSNLAR